MTSVIRRAAVPAVVLAAAVVFIYWPVVDFGFLAYDDAVMVRDNPPVMGGLSWAGLAHAFGRAESHLWDPLTVLSHQLDAQLFGAWAGGHHLINVLLHAAAAAGLIAFLAAATGNVWRASLAAAVFAVHPLRVESVAWIAERKDVLSGFFFMLCLCAYMAYLRRPTRLRFAAVAALFTLSLMAKPMAVTLPAVLLLLDWWPLGRFLHAARDGRRGAAVKLVLEKIPLAALAAVFSAATYGLQLSDEAVMPLAGRSMAARLINALVSYVRYLGATVWPVDLAVFYPYPAAGWPLWLGLAAGLFLLFAAVVAVMGRRFPWWATGWFWFMGMLLPVIGILQVGSQSMADRYTYLPGVGLAIAVAWSLDRPRPANFWATALIPIAALAALSLASRQQVGKWRDDIRLFRHAATVTGDNWLAYSNLALALAAAGEHRLAVEQYQRSIAARGDLAETHFNMGNALVRLGRDEEAESAYRRAVALRPGYVRARFSLGLLLTAQARFAEALEHLSAAAAADPGFAEARHQLGVALAAEGRYEEAVEHLRQAVRLDPGNDTARYNLAVVLEGIGQAPAEKTPALEKGSR